MLTLKNVTKKFNNITAVDDISLTINQGQVLGIVGRNGAGKSTLFRMILNLIPATSRRNTI